MGNNKGLKRVLIPRSYSQRIATGMLLMSLFTGENVLAQERSDCFMVGINGQLLDLSSICSPPPGISSQKTTLPEPIPEPDATATPSTTAPEEAPPPTNQGENPPPKKTPSNSNIRYSTDSSGLTQDSGITPTRPMSRKDKREAQRREAASQTPE